MNILDILEGIEKLLVELLLWIILIPKTLFKIITDPNWVSGYVEEELAKTSERFDNYISPILLFLTSSVVFFIIADQDIPNAKKALEALQGSKGILAALGFLSLPLLFSLATESFRQAGFTRKGIQRILYIQCFYFSPLTLSIFASGLLAFLLPDDEVVPVSAFFIAIGILIWFVIVEVKLIARELQSGKLKANFS